MCGGGKHSARWFGKPDTSGWEIYPNMFARRKLWSILNGRLRKRDRLLAKQRALGAALMLASFAGSLRPKPWQLTFVFSKFYKSVGPHVMRRLFCTTIIYIKATFYV